VTLISGGALAALTAAALVGIESSMILITGLLFVGRLLEVCIDAPATCVQYLKPAQKYFLLRLGLFVLLVTITGFGVASIDPTQQRAAVPQVAFWYLTGTGLALVAGLAYSMSLLGPSNRIRAELVDELRGQTAEFRRFFLASAFFVAASRIHPVVIMGVAGAVAAERFATIFNLFAALSLTATGIAGVFFWSRNRLARDHRRDGLPTTWLVGAIPGGLLLGVIGGWAIQELFLRPVNAPEEMHVGAWILCMATPVLITQSIISNTLVLQKRDDEMLLVSVINAALSIVVIVACVHAAGLIGASFAVGLSATLATLIGIHVVGQSR
jgi:O-antigen/teichoic acid export membrane protein